MELLERIGEFLEQHRHQRFCASCLATGLGFSTPRDNHRVLQALVEASEKHTPFEIADKELCDGGNHSGLVAWSN